MKIGAWDSDSGKTFVIAECGVNHGGDYLMAQEMVRVAAQAGADAVKFQWFDPDALVARRGPGAEHVRPYALSRDCFSAIQTLCLLHDVVFLCSVFDLASAEAYLALDPQAVKIGSGELGEHGLINRVARGGKPLVISTGMATAKEVEAAIKATYWDNGMFMHRSPFALLHCVSAYPCPDEQLNLRAMDKLREWGRPVGFSDHSVGITAALCAVARGAVIIEKHLTLDQGLPGPDHKASADPRTFADMVHRIRDVERILGTGEKRIMDCERATLKAVGR